MPGRQSVRVTESVYLSFIDSFCAFVNMSPMTEQKTKILEAALRVFSRYGVKRTSMADIAQEAKMARQTLYKTFRSKDDILCAYIRAYSDDVIAQIEQELSRTQGLGVQLDVIFDKMTVAGFDLVRATPNAQDLQDGFDDGSRAELEITAQRFQAVIASVLMPYQAALERAGTSPERLAEFIQRSARAAKSYAKNREHLLQQLETLKQLCLQAAKA